MAGDLYDAPNQEVVRGAPTGGQGSPEPEPEAYDPSAFTVDEVKAYAEAHPEELDAIYAAEDAGKARTTLLDWLAGDE